MTAEPDALRLVPDTKASCAYCDSPVYGSRCPTCGANASPSVQPAAGRATIERRIRRLVGLVDVDFSFDAREAYVAKEVDAILAAISTQAQASESGGEPEWVVNDIAELGVKIGDRFFWLYKGQSLVYGTEGDDVKNGIVQHDEGGDMHWRPVFKREFGECAHPINYADPTRIGTVSLDDSDDWKPLPAALSAPQAAPGEGEQS